MKYLEENKASFPMEIDYFRTRMKARLHALEMMHASNAGKTDLLANADISTWLQLLLKETLEMLAYCH